MKITYYQDQHGWWYQATSIKNLKEKYGLAGRALPMYEEEEDGSIYKVGYVIGDVWLAAYIPVRIKVTTWTR